MSPRRLTALMVSAGLLFAACGGSASPAPSTASTAPSASTEASASPSPSPTPEGPPVTIKWFCCLGTGDDPSQLVVEDQVVKDFNASQTHIKLVFDHAAYSGARDALATRIASGNGPDIVGPVGVGGANAFDGQWLDLAPFIQKNNYDLSQFDQGAVDFYKVGGQGQVGIPFAVYPSELYYQKDMFDEANLQYPPAKYGDQYQMPDGSMVDWNYDTLRQVAMLLTVDKNNKDATQPGFDPTHIVQYGFEPQRDDLRSMGAAYFGAGRLVGDDGKTAQIPDPWAAGWKWVYNGIWTDHFIMNNSVYQSQGFNGGGYAFNSGKVAMQENFLWNVCCVTDAGGNWDLGALPSYNGNVTAAFNADTFRILKSTKHPDEAFTALTYLLGDASTKLLNSYSGFPARKADQANFFTQLEQQTVKGKPVYPANVNWDVAAAGSQYADNPNFESNTPNYNKTLDVLAKYLTRWTSTPNLNMDTEINNLKTELQATFDKAS